MNDEKPKYRQVVDVIATKIRNGALPADSRLPSERELGDSYEISRMTARHVYTTLEDEGLIYRSNRRGWFVASPRLSYALMRSVSFISNVQAQGGIAKATILSQSTIKAPKSVGTLLNLKLGSRVRCLKRLLSIGDLPAMVECMYVAEKTFPDFFSFDLSQSILMLWKDQYGVDVKRAEATLSGACLTGETADALKLSQESPGIRLTQTFLDRTGNPIAIDIQDWPSELAEFSISVDFDTAG